MEVKSPKMDIIATTHHDGTEDSSIKNEYTELYIVYYMY